jgi:hypothetical protein
MPESAANSFGLALAGGKSRQLFGRRTEDFFAALTVDFPFCVDERAGKAETFDDI